MMELEPDEERQVLRLVEQAMEQPSEQQIAYIDDQLLPDVLKERARKLLQAAANGSEWVLEPSRPAKLLHRQPEQVGVYRILSVIGEGGMGRVYLGRRADGVYDREVAIKVMHPHVNPDQFAARFETERQILADLQHPNITQLIDGGSLPDGSPYLVMERINGVQIDQFVEQEGLDVRATLHLFMQLCDAVQAAHQRLIVHRDIKPSNVLVNRAGQAKLLDFGIAKLLTLSDAELTRTNAAWPMTFDYASPEQLQRKAVGTSTDIYSLGVLLYRLLSGHKPFDSSSQSFATFEKAVLEESVPPLRSYATQRRSSQFDADLDLIVRTAMAKEPERRYASAAALGQEIEDYLRGAPIRARGDSSWYQLHKFARRHLLAIAASAAVVVAFVAAFAVSVTQTRIARTEAQRSATTSELLTNILLAPSSRADSPLGLGSDAKISTLLAAAEQEVAKSSAKLSQTPAIEADLLLVIARAYHGLAMYNKADQLLQRANELCASAICDSGQLAALLAYHTGQVKVMLGQPQQALEYLAKAQELLTEKNEDGLLVANILNEKASALWSVGQREATLSTMEQAVQAYEEQAQDKSLVAVSYTRLGSLYSNLGRLSEGLVMLKRAATIHQELDSRALPEVADLYNEISSIHWKRGEKPESYAWLLKAYDVVTKIDGVSEIEIRILTNLGLETVVEDREQARRWLAQSKSALPKFASEIHEATAWVYMLEGRILSVEQNYEEAIAAFEKARKIYDALMPAYNDSHAGVDVSIGIAYQQLNQHAAALPFNQRVYDYYSVIYNEEETSYLRDARTRLRTSQIALGLTPVQ